MFVVFNDSRLMGGSSMHITNSLEARLSVAVQSALRIRERSLLGNGSHDETTYSYHNSTAVVGYFTTSKFGNSLKLWNIST